MLKDAQLARHGTGSEPTTLSLGKWGEVTFKPWRPTALNLLLHIELYYVPKSELAVLWVLSHLVLQ